TGVQAILSSAEPSARRVRRALEQAGFDLGRASAARVFAEGSHAGDSATFQADCDGLLLVAAPGGPMPADMQSPPTEIVLYIRRTRLMVRKAGQKPPEPLADPLADMNILPGNARAYEVRKGQYIQVLDVQGRECSDFQALDMRALE